MIATVLKTPMITRAYCGLKVCNSVLSRYELGEEGERTRHIPVEILCGRH